MFHSGRLVVACLNGREEIALAFCPLRVSVVTLDELAWPVNKVRYLLYDTYRCDALGVVEGNKRHGCHWCVFLWIDNLNC